MYNVNKISLDKCLFYGIMWAIVKGILMNMLTKFYDRQFFGYCGKCNSTQTVPIGGKAVTNPMLSVVILHSIRECCYCGTKEIYNKIVIEKAIEDTS